MVRTHTALQPSADLSWGPDRAVDALVVRSPTPDFGWIDEANWGTAQAFEPALEMESYSDFHEVDLEVAGYSLHYNNLRVGRYPESCLFRESLGEDTHLCCWLGSFHDHRDRCAGTETIHVGDDLVDSQGQGAWMAHRSSSSVRHYWTVSFE